MTRQKPIEDPRITEARGWWRASRALELAAPELSEEARMSILRAADMEACAVRFALEGDRVHALGGDADVAITTGEVES